MSYQDHVTRQAETIQILKLQREQYRQLHVKELLKDMIDTKNAGEDKFKTISFSKIVCSDFCHRFDFDTLDDLKYFKKILEEHGCANCKISSGSAYVSSSIVCQFNK